MVAIFNYNGAQERIRNVVGGTTYRDMLRYLQCRDLKLWGAAKPHDFVEICMVATASKDVLGLSYADIILAFSNKISFFPRAIHHNIKLCRRSLRNWAHQYITPGDACGWKRAADRANLPIWLKGVRLWMDSTDIKIAKKGRKREPKSKHWSAKLQAPGRRFSVVSDADGVIRKAWSGVSPKVYDTDFVISQKDTLEDNFAGATIIADNHYWVASKKMRDPKFLACAGKKTTVAEARKARFAQTKEELRQRRPEAKEARARVETNFSSLKRTFRSLRGEAYMPWRESLQELDHTFVWACGVHNYKKLRPEQE
mgnify:CR=1 FL=1